MPNFPRSYGSSVRLLALGAVFALLPPTSVQAQWIGALTGVTDDPAHSFLDTANWTGGVVSDVFGPATLTGTTTLHFNNNHATTGLWDLTYGGNFNLSLQSTGGPFTVTLGGNVTADATGGNRAINIGNAGAGLELALDLGGVQRTFTVGANDTLTIHNSLVGATGGLIKAGSGTLLLLDGSVLGGTVQVSSGTLRIDSADVLAAGANVVLTGGNIQARGIGGATHNLDAPVSITANEREIQAFRSSGSGNFILNVNGVVSTTAASRIRYEGQSTSVINQTGAMQWGSTGNSDLILDGTGATLNISGGGTFAGTNQQFTINPQSGNVNITSNDFVHGTGLTIIDGSSTARVRIDAASRLGAGNVRINGGGMLILDYDGALPGSGNLSFGGVGGGSVVFGQAQTAFPTLNIPAFHGIGGNLTGAIVGTNLTLAEDAALIVDGPEAITGLTLNQATLGVTGKTFWRAISTSGGSFEIGTTVNGSSDPEGIFKGFWFGASQPTAAGNSNFNGSLATPVGSGDDLEIFAGAVTRITGGTWSPDSGVVNIHGVETFELAAAPAGAYTEINRFGASTATNNTIFRLDSADDLKAGVTLNIHNGRLDLDAANVLAATAVVNINDGGTLDLNQTPSTGTYNINDRGAVFIENSARLNGGATFNVGAGPGQKFLIIDVDVNVAGNLATLMPQFDLILDDENADNPSGAGLLLGQDRRLQTTSSRSADVTGAGGATPVARNVGLAAGADAASFVAAAGRTLAMSTNTQIDFSGGTLHINLPNGAVFETTVGSSNNSSDNMGRVNVASTGTVTVGGELTNLTADAINVHAGTFRHLAGGTSVNVGVGGTGVTTVAAGATLQVETGNAFNSAVDVEVGGVFRAIGTGGSPRTVTIGSLAGGGNVFLGATTGTEAIVLRTGQNDLSTEFSGNILAVTGHSGQLLKVGTGTLTLSGANNNYVGTTTVAEGGLLVNGTLVNAAGLVTVNAGAVLGGTGTIDRAVTVNGTLAAGASAGTLDIGGVLTFGADSNLAVELGGDNPGDGFGFYDQVNMTLAGGSVAIGADVGLDVTFIDGFVGNDGDAFYILTREDSGDYGNTFAGLAEGDVLTVGAAQFTITYEADWLGSQGASSLTGGNDVALVLAAVPEPGTYALLGVVGCLALWRRRRKQVGSCT